MPEGSCLVQVKDGVGEVGIEPSAGAFDEDIDGDLGATLHAEGIEVLGDAHEAREQGDVVTPAALGIAAAIPVLVEVADGDGGLSA